MSYDPRGGYPEPGEPHRRPGDSANTIARIVTTVTGIVATIFIAHIVFSLADANDNNEIVAFVYQLARALVLGFGDVFTPDDEKIGLVLNYGLAALVYVVVGQFIARALRRR